MEKVTISLESLYVKYKGVLEKGTIEKTVDGESEYYDLYTADGLVCMDGETCGVKRVYDEFTILINENGEEDKEFRLTSEEMKVGAF